MDNECMPKRYVTGFLFVPDYGTYEIYNIKFDEYLNKKLC